MNIGKNKGKKGKNITTIVLSSLAIFIYVVFLGTLIEDVM
jgi:hypothetical protein